MTRSTFGLFLRIFACSVAILGTFGRIFLAFEEGEGLDIVLYFTVQSNLMVCGFLAVELIRTAKIRVRQRPVFPAAVQGGILLYILLTGLVFNTMLARYVEVHGLSKLLIHVNHTVTPLLFLADWLFNQKKGSYRPKHIGLWLLYPVAYMIFGSIEGVVVGEFRYYFLDFITLPIATYLLSLGIVIASFLLLGGAIVLVDRKMKTGQEATNATQKGTR